MPSLFFVNCPLTSRDLPTPTHSPGHREGTLLLPVLTLSLCSELVGCHTPVGPLQRLKGAQCVAQYPTTLKTPSAPLEEIVKCTEGRVLGTALAAKTRATVALGSCL